MFIDQHEHKNVVKYRDIFFKEMKLLLLYFIKFSKDGSILSKKYSSNYILKRPD